MVINAGRGLLAYFFVGNGAFFFRDRKSSAPAGPSVPAPVPAHDKAEMTRSYFAAALHSAAHHIGEHVTPLVPGSPARAASRAAAAHIITGRVGGPVGCAPKPIIPPRSCRQRLRTCRSHDTSALLMGGMPTSEWIAWMPHASNSG